MSEKKWFLYNKKMNGWDIWINESIYRNMIKALITIYFYSIEKLERYDKAD